MKHHKLGFSLAEVLISLGIVSVIASIGFTLAKRGIESAYNQYIYTGYKGISSAFAEAIAQGKTIGNDDFQAVVIDLIGMEDAEGSFQDGFITTNQTIFTITDDGKFDSGWVIKMQVPKKRTKGSSHLTICLNYLPNTDYAGILIPINSVANTCTSDINLATRKDLLPFYIDDGEAGRVIPNGDSFTYKPREYLSINEALCKIFEGDINGSPADAIVSCPAGSGTMNGVIKVADPRKVY